MIGIRAYAVLSLVLVLSACASTPPRAVRSDFDDIPVPKGLTYQADASTVIESPAVHASRRVYRGRVELDSLASAIRSTLEANGWRHVSSSSSAKHGTTQVYEKPGSSLQVLLWEGSWYTYAEYSTTRALQPPR